MYTKKKVTAVGSPDSQYPAFQYAGTFSLNYRRARDQWPRHSRPPQYRIASLQVG